MRQRAPASWGSSKRRGRPPHLLVEDGDIALTVSDFSMFRDAGFVVAHCAGPGAAPSSCPLLCGPCPLIAGADVVLHGLDPSLGIIDAIRQRRPELPVVTIGRN
jgi:hypothetical protein